MPSINISELCPVGSHFFEDSESFLNELSDSEFQNIKGGASIASDVGNSALNNTFGNGSNDAASNRIAADQDLSVNTLDEAMILYLNSLNLQLL